MEYTSAFHQVCILFILFYSLFTVLIQITYVKMIQNSKYIPYDISSKEMTGVYKKTLTCIFHSDKHNFCLTDSF